MRSGGAGCGGGLPSRPLAERGSFQTLDVPRGAASARTSSAPGTWPATPAASLRSQATRCSRSATSSSCASGSRSPTGSWSIPRRAAPTTSSSRRSRRAAPAAARVARRRRAPHAAEECGPLRPCCAPLDTRSTSSRRARASGRARGCGARARAQGMELNQISDSHEGDRYPPRTSSRTSASTACPPPSTCAGS